MMHTLFEALCLVPIIGGSIYAILCLISVLWFKTTTALSPRPSPMSWPPVTILKPVCGLEKNLRENLCSACVLTAFLWAGSAAAASMSHESHDGSVPGAMTQTSHGTAQQAVASTGAEDIAYSLFMHQSSGVAVIVLGVLVLTDRLTNRRYGALRVGISLVWLAFGAYLFIRSDPEGWPIGPAGFVESLSMPTSGEWLQHKLLSLVPLALGVWTFVSRRADPHPFWSYALGAVLVLGGAALFVHQHLDHQTMDLVNLQHRFMAVTALLIAAFLMADGLSRLTWKAKPFLMPCGLIALGLQLALYIE